MRTPPWSTPAKLAGAAVLTALVAGCAVTPDYQKPGLTPPAAFRFQPEPPGAASIADSSWAEVYPDPVLQALIAEGMANNQDLQIAAARIERARAILGVARSAGLPQLNYRFDAGGENRFVPDSRSIGTAQVGTVGGALEAAWEFDVWGRIKRSTEAAQANLMAEEAVRHGVMLSLVADLSTGYFRLLQLDREVAIAQESEQVFRQSVDLYAKRFEAGRDNRLPVERARANYEASTAKVEDLRRLIALQEDAISVLVGGYPHAIARGRPLLSQPLTTTSVGPTTALLQRRPDILEAEQRMIAANAEVGVAIANKFPRIGLSALAGGLTAGFEGHWDEFGVWNLALSAAGPIFSGGRLQSIEKERRAHWDETVAGYRRTVLVAFRETADALAAEQTLARRRVALQNQVDALRRATELAATRYSEGRVGYYEVLEAQQLLYPAEDALAQTEGEQLVAVVSLYKALGGGWQQAASGASASAK